MAVRIHGRHTQVEVLRQQFDALRAGRGGVVFITGSAGSGKTTMLAEAVRLARVQGMRVFRGAGDRAAQTLPLGPVLDALVVTDDPPVDPARLSDLSHSPDQRFWLLRELQEGLERAALRAPVVIAIDDLQWADAATVAALGMLPPRLVSHRILWLLAVRRGELTAQAQDAIRRLEGAGALEIPLDRLDDAAVAEIAADQLGGRPDYGLLEALGRAEGQPFLLMELLRGLREEQLVEITDGAARLVGTRLPRRFVDSVGEQLRALGAEERDAVEMASVLGRRFSVDELAALVGRPAPELLRALRQVIDSGLIVADGERLGFRHDLVREAVDASLPGAVRRSLRRRAVDVMLAHGAPAADVAMLVMDIAQPGDPVATELLARAAGDIGRMSPAVAAPLARRALELTPAGDPARGARVVTVIDLLVQAGQAAEAANLISAAAADLSDHVAEAEARLSIGMLMTQYAPAAVAEQCRRGLELSGVPAALRVQLLSLLACGLEIVGDIGAAAEPLRTAVGEADASGDPANAVVTLVPRALLALSQGDWRKAVDLAGDAVARQHRAGGHALRLWLSDAWRALILVSLMRIDEAHAVIEAGTRASEGIAANIRIWSMLRCRVRLAAGHLADAGAEAEAILDMSDELGDGNFGYLNHIASYVLGDIAVHTGSAADLRSARQQAARLRQTPGCQSTQRLGAWLDLRLAAMNGPVGIVDQHTLELLAPGYLHASTPIAACDAVELVRLLQQAGQRADAASVLDRLEHADKASPGFPFLRAAAVHARAVLDGDRDAAGLAVELYQTDPRPLVRASALEDAGNMVSARAPKQAVTRLDEALRLYVAAGAERDAARLRRMLRGLGVTRAGARQLSSPRWPELTESEVAVTRLVTQGATDREVADQLFISAHTVNSHLRHIFAKLGIRSRVELTRLAGERGAPAS
jgi:DNA-binding NarL/FixJ family response regulator